MSTYTFFVLQPYTFLAHNIHIVDINNSEYNKIKMVEKGTKNGVRYRCENSNLTINHQNIVHPRSRKKHSSQKENPLIKSHKNQWKTLNDTLSIMHNITTKYFLLFS